MADSIQAHYDKWDKISAEIEDDPADAPPAGPPGAWSALLQLALCCRALRDSTDCC